MVFNKLKRLTVGALVCLLIFTSCGTGQAQTEFYAMDTYMHMSAHGKGADKALEKAAERIRELDTRFSVSSISGEIGTLLQTGELSEPSPELIEILTCAKTLWERTDGAYDVTAYALSRLWGFGESEQSVPSQADIERTLNEIGMEKIEFDASRVRLNGVLGIDLGSVAKGFAGGEAAKILKEEGVSGALLTLGGNVVAVGEKKSGELYRIGITDPRDTSKICGYITVGETNVVTSGKYNRYFEADGKKFHHIIDAETGYPAENGVASVTVICESGMWADALSTALFLLGEQGALDYYSKYGGFEAILIMDDGRIVTTEGARAIFKAA